MVAKSFSLVPGAKGSRPRSVPLASAVQKAPTRRPHYTTCLEAITFERLAFPKFPEVTNTPFLLLQRAEQKAPLLRDGVCQAKKEFETTTAMIHYMDQALSMAAKPRLGSDVDTLD